MATKREQIVVDIGGDAKALMKEFDLTKRQAQKWVHDVSNSISKGELPESWQKYSKNASAALHEIQRAAETIGTKLTRSIGKAAAGFVAWSFAKKIIGEVNKALDEAATKIDKFNDKIDAAGFKDKRDKAAVASLPESVQREILAAQFEKTTLLDGIKLKAAQAAARAWTAGRVWAGVLRTGSFDESMQNVLGGQKELWNGMKAAQAEKDLIATKKVQEDAAAEEAKRRSAIIAARREHDHDVLKSFGVYEEKMRERNAKRIEKENALLAQQKALRESLPMLKARAEFGLGKAIHDEFLPTLDELATNGLYRNEAQRLQFLQSDTKDAILWNDQRGIGRNVEEIQSIRDRLTKAGVFKDPNAALINEFKVLTDPIRATGILPVQVELAK